jgi:hypothetical protein
MLRVSINKLHVKTLFIKILNPKKSPSVRGFILLLFSFSFSFLFLFIGKLVGGFRFPSNAFPSLSSAGRPSSPASSSPARISLSLILALISGCTSLSLSLSLLPAVLLHRRVRFPKNSALGPFDLILQQDPTEPRLGFSFYLFSVF